VPYYKTSITFKSLDNPAEFLISISKGFVVPAKLTARDLPKTISVILLTTKEDITIKYSCPDWDNPCKHIAGLYFKIAEEIEYNPLLIFDLRGVPEKLLSRKIKKHIKPIIKNYNQLIHNTIRADKANQKTKKS